MKKKTSNTANTTASVKTSALECLGFQQSPDLY